MRHHPFSILNLLSAVLWAAAPASAAGTVDVTKAGVVGDGATLNTAALQQAIDACSAQGGGTLAFPAGRYLTGTIQLKDNVTLNLDADAVLLGSPNAADYRNVDPFTDGSGNTMGYALIVADGAKHVGIVGAGTVDGQGRLVRAGQTPFKIRPFLMRWLRCTDVTLKDVHLTNPGAWTLNFFQTHGATVEHVTIRTRATGLSNNDGIDLDSCENVRIKDCDIDSGDDALCVKATSPLPSRDITASGCILSTKCNAIKFGTESLGDFENISVTGCQLRNVGMSGIALNSVDGAHLQHVTIADITMDGVAVPISIRLGSRLKVFRPVDTPKPTGVIRDVTIRNVQAKGVRQIGFLVNGVPGHPVENITFENVSIEVPGGGTAAAAEVKLKEMEAAYPEYSMFGKVMPASGLYLRHVRGATFTNVHATVLKPDERPALALVDVEGLNPPDFSLTATAAAK